MRNSITFFSWLNVWLLLLALFLLIFSMFGTVKSIEKCLQKPLSKSCCEKSNDGHDESKDTDDGHGGNASFRNGGECKVASDL